MNLDESVSTLIDPRLAAFASPFCHISPPSSNKMLALVQSPSFHGNFQKQLNSLVKAASGGNDHIAIAVTLASAQVRQYQLVCSSDVLCIGCCSLETPDAQSYSGSTIIVAQ
jgi:hypothetical protein